jgi:hypothetical protein
MQRLPVRGRILCSRRERAVSYIRTQIFLRVRKPLLTPTPWAPEHRKSSYVIRILSPLLPLLVAVSMPAIAVAGNADSAALALDNVRLVDADRDRVSAARCVRIEGTQLVRIVRSGARACRRDATVIDLGGRFVLPGLIDMHAHLTLGPL